MRRLLIAVVLGSACAAATGCSNNKVVMPSQTLTDTLKEGGRLNMSVPVKQGGADANPK